MSLYLDTSCLLKLLFAEPESAKTSLMLAAEPRVLVSSLARLEALVQIQGRAAGGLLTSRSAVSLARLLDQTLASAPFDLVTTPTGTDGVAASQIFPLSRSVHCRTLDRLHLAAMQALGVRRLLTNDDAQARAASALGFEGTASAVVAAARRALISPLLRSRQPPIFSPSNDISPKRTREIFNNWCRMASPAALSARGRLSGTTISTKCSCPWWPGPRL